ncbi:hypothetical protein JD844_012462 [Phrynosoma platyrhinos]|uniref:Cadherin domain-containing protein n=1 Tax=Phrynosoma platyrhinos TaxID=52577 RepID=A0ABQ7TKR1_PHRPL|nr:hypothetical protein JD844_012462 [Phrynosoma platyrhinos]
MLWDLHSLTAVFPVVVLDGVPRTVWLEDSATPGTIVANFTVQCANSSFTANVIQKNISPMTSFFNQPNILSDGNYQVSLGPSAALDAKQVSLYVLTYSAHCAGESDEFQLFIRVTPADKLECSSRSGIGRVPLQVPEDITPGTYIYRLVLKRRGTSMLNFAIENTSLPFEITPDGIVRAPAAGFSHEQASKVAHGNLQAQKEEFILFSSCYRESSVTKSISENTGPLQEIIQVRASGENVLYQIISPSTNYFTIVPETGVIKNTYNLDLKRNPSLAETQLLVKAYNKLHPSDCATIMVNITVKQNNLEGPLCSPAVFVTNIPETIPIGRTLLTLSCNDPEDGNSSLHYQMEDAQSPLYSFQMEGPNLQVNTTLDCDSAVMASLSFQYRAAILVRDNGSPPRTTRVPVLVTVSPVNEYAPECLQRFFSVPENAGFGEVFGNASGTDRDYPFNNIEYSILGAEAGAPTLFYIGRRTGQLHVLGPGPLDYEEKKAYHLTISLKDLDNDANPNIQMTTLCNITINVQDMNDNRPVCDPPFYERSIYSTQARTISVVQLACTDKDERSELIYNIVGGNTNGRFRMDGNRLFPNTFSYNHDGIFDPLTFELLVQVTDSHSIPRFSTTAVILVHVIPWTTTVPTTTTTTTTVPKEPIILHKTEEYWAPDPWFVVVITLTGVLLLSALGLLFWQFCWRKTPGEMSKPLLQNKEAPLDPSLTFCRAKGLERNYIMAEEPSKKKGKESTEVLSLPHQFDGRAQDPVTGQYYLFDSSTGARRWV